MNDEFTPEAQPTEDYEVGFKKPPKSGQWKKGQSGNPKGRPKRSSDIAECLERRLAMTREMMIDGRLQRITYADRIALQMLKETLEGKTAARRDVIQTQQRRIAGQRESEQPGDREIICELVLDDVDRQAEVLEKNRKYLEEIRRLQGIPDWKVE